MKARDLIQQFRVEVADPLVPGTGHSVPDEDSLWKDDELLGYLNEAQREVVRRTFALSIRKSFDVLANEAFVPLPDDFMVPRRARLIGARRVLQVRNANEMAESVHEDYGATTLADWEEMGPSEPRVVVFDDSPGEARLVPEPADADTLEIHYYRWPAPISYSSEALQLDYRLFQRPMLHWMKFLAYRKQDADALDLQRSQIFGAEFEREIDRVYGELRREYRRAGNVRYGGL